MPPGKHTLPRRIHPPDGPSQKDPARESGQHRTSAPRRPETQPSHHLQGRDRGHWWRHAKWRLPYKDTSEPKHPLPRYRYNRGAVLTAPPSQKKSRIRQLKPMFPVKTSYTSSYTLNSLLTFSVLRSRNGAQDERRTRVVISQRQEVFIARYSFSELHLGFFPAQGRTQQEFKVVDVFDSPEIALLDV